MYKTSLGRPLMMILAALTLVACGSQPTDVSRQDDRGADKLEGAMVGQRWNLLLVGTDERLSMPTTPHFTISPDGRVNGHDGCNTLNGKVQLGDSNRIEFSELATTRMGCPQLDDARRVTGMMENAYRYLIDHDRLVFFGPDQRVLGGFRKAN
ncbi:META domain-containing protein [Billgrantia endophytica]|uniref:META domain-containing protein n=1 Tax=Billgrantia endophytica TaxID=2033802 RepID=A0A2N7U1J8_9GAMM|nr:META domain-containing protein [Halomonas endophytica]PMR74304.1 META domain-containing protein [Halomonas endophytica]